MSDHRAKPVRLGADLMPACPATGKVRHATRAEAEVHAEGLRLSKGDRLIGTYRCTGRHGCQGWHAGHRPRGKKGKRR